jgi:chorismate mutase
VARKTVNDDPLIGELREQIADLDRSIVEAVNARLRLVTELKRHKESRGLDFHDPEREQWLLQYLQRANGGPLSDDGLRELFAAVLGLTKREVARGDEPG